MPYNGVGLFTSLGAPTFPAVPNTYILARYFNATMNDIFTGLSSVMTRDGQSPATANIPLGGNKITGLGTGVDPADATTVLQVFTAPTIASPTLTGIPVAPTASGGTNTTQVATCAFVLAQALSGALPLQTGNAGKYITTDGTTASWGMVSPSLPVTVVTGTAVTAVAKNHYALANGTAVAVTLPASPASGDLVRITAVNGSSTNSVLRNGQTIMGSATNLTLDNPYTSIALQFLDSSWRLVA